MIYCISDLHGNFDKYTKMLNVINFSDDDTLYVLGDIIDEGDKSIEILQDMMYRPNIIPILGNHEYAAVETLKILLTEITDDSINALDENFIQNLMEWMNIGGQATIADLHKLNKDDRIDILNYLYDFSLYEEVIANNKDYILVHAGLSNFSKERPLQSYKLHELIFEPPDYNSVYFKDKFLVTGHIPTRFIEENNNKDCIYKANNHIAIDCGVSVSGKLGCICLDNLEEFYV